MKKWLRRTAMAAVCLLILSFGADLLVRWGSGWNWTREWAVEKASAALNREVRLEKMSASFMGIKLDGLEISEEGGFKNGTFLSAKRIRLRADLLCLLGGDFTFRSFTVNEVNLHLERLADGTFNFQSLGNAKEPSAPASSSKESFPFGLTLGQLTVRNLNITYADPSSQTKAALSDALFSVRRFSFRKQFGVTFQAEAAYEKDGKLFSVPVQLKAKARLEDFNLQNAVVEITDFLAQYQEASVNLQLTARNLEQPAVKARLELKDLSAATFADLLPDIVPFAVSEATVNTQFQVTPSAQTLKVADFQFSMPGATARFAGDIYYGEAPRYEVDSSFEVNAAQAALLFPQWNEQYRPEGLFKGEGSWNKEGAKAQFSLQNGSAKIEHMGQFTDVSMSFSATENALFNQGNATGKFNGKLNGEEFKGTLQVVQTPKNMDADVWLRAGRVALPPLKKAVEEEPASPDGFVADTSLAVTPKEAWPLPPVNVRADIQIDSLDAPYVYGTDIVFRSELTGVTPDLKQTHGDLQLTMGNGEIKDLYHLTNANAVTKVLFLSVNIVGKVFNSMNVFAVLDGLGNGLLNVMGGGDSPEVEKEADLVVKTVTGPDGQPMQIMVPYTDRKIDGRLVYDKFATKVRFEQGVADVNGGTFVSDMVSFTLDGETDFNTGKLDMTVQAAPGKHEADGIMPLRVKVGGTVSDPKGSMSLLGSVSSFVTQGLGNNFASRSVKKGIGGLFGLFKKKPTPAAELPENPQPEQPPQEPLVPGTTPEEKADLLEP